MKTIEKFSAQIKATHIYQPLIIQQVLHGNKCLDGIAKELVRIECNQLGRASKDLDKDIKYYVKQLKRYPSEVLKKHGVAEIKDNCYVLLLPIGSKKKALHNLELLILDLIETRDLFKHRDL